MIWQSSVSDIPYFQNILQNVSQQELWKPGRMLAKFCINGAVNEAQFGSLGEVTTMFLSRKTFQ